MQTHFLGHTHGLSKCIVIQINEARVCAVSENNDQAPWVCAVQSIRLSTCVSFLLRLSKRVELCVEKGDVRFTAEDLIRSGKRATADNG